MNSASHFESIVSAHYQPLFRFAMSLTRAESDAKDLTQQTFCTWAAKGHQLHDRSKVKAWLFATLHRAFLQTRRRQVRFPHCDLDDVPEDFPLVAPIDISCIDSPQVLAALAKMDSIYQAAVALFYLEDYSYKEIAAILEVPLGTVKSRITRGLVQLRNLLADPTPSPCSDADRDLSAIPVPELIAEF
jgi:RNA polymerase sigma-70 factor, ECF subfamily